MDFVDRKEEQARSLTAIQAAEKKFVVVYGGAVWEIDAHQICLPRY